MNPVDALSAASQYLDAEAAGARILSGALNLLERCALAAACARSGAAAKSMLRGLADFEGLQDKLSHHLQVQLRKQLAKMDTVFEVLRGCLAAVDKGQAAAVASGAKRGAPGVSGARPAGPDSDAASVAYAASPRVPCSVAEGSATTARVAALLRADLSAKCAAWESFSQGLALQEGGSSGSLAPFGALFELLASAGQDNEASLRGVASALACLCSVWVTALPALQQGSASGSGWRSLPLLYYRLTGREWAPAAVAPI